MMKVIENNSAQSKVLKINTEKRLSSPSKNMIPALAQTGLSKDSCLNLSLAEMFEIWTSTTGMSVDLIASLIATDVCV